MKNVTFSLDDTLLEKARARARSQGKSLNVLVREMLSREVDPDPLADLRQAWNDADRRGSRSESPHPTRDEIYAERLERYPHA